MHPENLGDVMIVTRSQLQRLQSRIQASLLLIQQTEEENDGCLHFVY